MCFGCGVYLDREQTSEIDLRDGFGHGLVLNAASFRLHVIQLIGRPD